MSYFKPVNTLFLLSILFNVGTTKAQSASQNITYEYDELGRLIVVGDSSNTNRNYFYDPAGNRTYMALGTDFPPQTPLGLLKSQIANCAWRADWAPVANATYYNFKSTVDNIVSVATNTYAFSCPTNNPTANQPDWVQACNTHGCSAKAYF